MYPSKGGRPIERAVVEYVLKNIKNEKISIACDLVIKQAFLDLASREGLVMSEFGHRIVEWVLQIAQELEDESLLSYLEKNIKALQEMGEKISGQVQTISLQEAKMARLEKEVARLAKENSEQKKTIEKLSEEKLAIIKNNILIEVPEGEALKEAFEHYCQDRIELGLNKTKAGVVAYLLFEEVTSYPDHIAKAFNCKGEYRKVVKRLSNQ